MASSQGQCDELPKLMLVNITHIIPLATSNAQHNHSTRNNQCHRCLDNQSICWAAQLLSKFCIAHVHWERCFVCCINLCPQRL